ELSAGDVPRTGHVTGVVGVALADVEDDEIPTRATAALPHFVHRHERDAGCRLVEQLRHGLAARAVRPERLGEMIGHAEAQRAHLLDERGSIALLEPRVLRL